MTDEPKTDGARPIVRHGGIEYPIIGELTEREKFEAERLSGRSLDETTNYTAALLLAFFTLRRNGVALTFDEFLDASGFELGTEKPPKEEVVGPRPPALAAPPSGSPGRSDDADESEPPGEAASTVSAGSRE